MLGRFGAYPGTLHRAGEFPRKGPTTRLFPDRLITFFNRAPADYASESAMPIYYLMNAMLLILSPQDENQPIQTNAASLARIKSIYVKTESWALPDEGATRQKGGRSDPKKSLVAETWRVGLRERSVDRIYASFGPGESSEYPDGSVIIRGLTDKEVRDLRGWDPAKPFVLPLDSAKRVEEFSRVRGTLAPRDPIGAASAQWRTLLFEIHPGYPLAKIAEVSEISRVKSDVAGLICFEVNASRIPRVVGRKIYLDPEHGYLVRRMTWKNGGINLVEDFYQFPDGIWVPKRIRNSLGSTHTITEVVDCRVNSPITDAELAVDFPEGARVYEPDKGLIHIWGKDGPLRTFTKDTELAKFIEDHAREVNSASPGGVGVSVFRSRPLFWTVNIVLLSVLAALIVIRKRMSQRPIS